MFEPHRGAVVSLCPQESDHFAKRANPTAAALSALEQPSNDFLKVALFGPSVSHEQQEGLLRVEGDVPIFGLGARQVDPLSLEPLIQIPAVSRRRDDNRALVVSQTAGDEAFQGVEQSGVLLIDLDKVLARGHFRPKHFEILWFVHDERQPIARMR